MKIFYTSHFSLHYFQFTVISSLDLLYITCSFMHTKINLRTVGKVKCEFDVREQVNYCKKDRK